MFKRLGVNTSEETWGASFDRGLTMEDFRTLSGDMTRDVRDALFARSFIEGTLETSTPPGCKIKDLEDQRVTTLVHGDSVVRFVLTPPGGREEGLWLFHPDDHGTLLLAGMEFFLESEALSAATNEHIKQERARVENGRRPNKPWYPLVRDAGFTSTLVMGYQERILKVPNIRKKRIDFTESSPTKVVAMRPSLPHMREVLSASQFIATGSVHRLDEYEGD